MLDRFYTGFADTQHSELMQYCKLENVLPAALSSESKSKNTIMLQLEKTAFHLLQRFDRRLNALISRLTADLEHNSRAQRYLS